MIDVCCVAHTRDQLGETPLWCGRTRTLWWIDIEQPRLHALDPTTGDVRSKPFDARFLGSLALRRSGGLLLALDRTLHLYDPDSLRLDVLCDVETGPADTRLNDGRCDAQGRFWVGTMDVGLREPLGGLYCVRPDGRTTKHLDGVVVSNSIAISPDQRTLYYSDTRRFTMWAFDLDPDSGELSNQRIFADHTATGDRPDGACVDEDGGVWVAMFAGGRIARHRPDGTLDREIPLPVTNPTCICFGGPDLSTLYVTTARKFLTPEQLDAEPLAGGLLSLKPGVKGLPESEFAG